MTVGTVGHSRDFPLYTVMMYLEKHTPWYSTTIRVESVVGYARCVQLPG